MTIGHRAVLHGCTIADRTLIGIGATVLDGECIGRHCIVAAGALVPPRRIIPDGALVMGCPARVVRELSAVEIELITHASEHYVRNITRYKEQLRGVTLPANPRSRS